MKKVSSIVLIVIAALAVLIAVGVAAARLIGDNNEESLPQGDVSQTVMSTTAPTTTAPVTTEPETTAPITIKQTEKKTTESTTAATTAPKNTDKDGEESLDFTLIDILPLSLASGSWDVKHCQGMAIDTYKGYVYYSYTNSFVKCDLEGNVIGTITGIKGHLGDICYNKEDGRVYASYNPSGKKALYTAIIDVDNLNGINLDALECNLIRTVHLKEVWKDYSTNVTFTETQMVEVSSANSIDTVEKVVSEKIYKRKYGVTGTDAVTFGPSFSTGKGNYFTVSCGVTPNTERTDNDYQILIQYDVNGWWDTWAKPLSFDSFHHSGPEGHNGKYFIYTGSTTYGVQTMTYFREMNLWILNVYTTKKTGFVNYNMFIVDGDVQPRREYLIGQPKDDEQYVLSLYQDGEYDKKTGIYGWHVSKGNKGIEYISDGLFYIIHPFKTWYKTQTAVAYLYVWDASGEEPFTLAAGIGNNYEIGEKKPYIPPPTTTRPTTTAAPTTTAKPAINIEDIFSIFS